MALMKLSNFLNAVAIKNPTGVWEQIIMAFNGGIQNYAWAIIVLTIVIKIILLPLDFFNKKITVKNTRVQAELQPEIEKIQKKYGNNKQAINQKTMELYKKHNYNVTGSCIIMLVYMAVTLFIFFTLFSGLNSMAAYKVGNQYQQIETTYDKVALGITYDKEMNITEDIETKYEVYNSTYNLAYESQKLTIKTTAENLKREEIIARHAQDEQPYTQQDFEQGGRATDAEKLEVSKAGEDAVALQTNVTLMENKAKEAAENALVALGTTYEQVIEEIKTETLKTYNNVKESWLWIDNVWQSDVPWKKSLTTFDEYVSLTRISYKDDVTEETETFYLRQTAQKDLDKAKYEEINGLIESQNRVNGYLIVPILAVAVNVLSMLASQGKLKLPKKKKKEEIVNGEKPPKKPGGLVMLILLPLLMGYISISYNAVFALYIFVSSLIGLATTPLINFGIKKWDEIAQKRKEKKANNEVSYKR